MPAFDCIVLGVGGFGSGVLDHLARRGLTVLGLDRFGVAHDRGSSHGQTRIIRKAYFEHPDYVPLCKRAYELWNELQAEDGTELMRLCGLLLSGPEEGEAIAGAKLAARLHDLPIDSLTADEAMSRFPGFRIPPEFAAVFEQDAGFLFVEECVRAHIERAQRNGATVRTGASVVSWTSDGATAVVRTDKGEYAAAKLVVTPGAWATRLLPGLPIPLEVVRKPLFWYSTDNPAHRVENGCPGFLFDRPDGVFYGFPSLDGRTMKVAEHTGGATVVDPLQFDRDVHPSDTEPLTRFLSDHLPGVATIPSHHAVCMYTLTPDRHFIVDVHPEWPNVVIGCGFSGHGFKFTTVLGEAIADLAMHGRTGLPIEFLSLKRGVAE